MKRQGLVNDTQPNLHWHTGLEHANSKSTAKEAGREKYLTAVEENVVRNKRNELNADVVLETMDIYGTVELVIMLLATHKSKNTICQIRQEIPQLFLRKVMQKERRSQT